MTASETQEFIGNLTTEKCPKCGSTLLKNKKGDIWCSFVKCDFGCEDLFKEKESGK